MVSQEISQETNRRVLIASLCVAVVVIGARIGARWFKFRKSPFAADDISMYIALASFIIMCALYLSILPSLHRILNVRAGLEPPWATMKADLTRMLKEFFAVQIFFWLTLWAVKCSLLFMFKGLIGGLTAYNRIWWAVMIFTILTYIGCVVSHFTSCSSMDAWFHVGKCSTNRDATAKAASLWYALAVDLLTDLMIMVIPIKVLRTLRISLFQKFSVSIVFFVGIITMIFAIVRVVSLDSNTSSGQVRTTWLILWAAVEGMVALIVGSLPAFAIFIRGRVEAPLIRANSNNVNSPRKLNLHTPSSTGLSQSHLPSLATPTRGRMDMVTMNNVGNKPTSNSNGRKRTVEDASIMVTHGWSQRHPIRDGEESDTSQRAFEHECRD